ncbi:electron transfer flavoprotein subunit beta/FixA family protein [bacterium]|nr:electron transfer flavoprotein subunit beta/FixA family protein [bacterium]
MDSIVCIKRVPETAEATLKIDSSNLKLDEENLVFSINEADNYALEQALLLQEEFGGDVTIVSVGPEKTDEIIRMALAKGATSGIRITPSNLEELDPASIAKLIADEVKDLDYDLIFTGCIASDDGFSQVGVTLAEMLGINHISMAVEMEAEEETAKINRELEGGLMEKFEVKYPAVITIQTGINEPRYASILGIKRAGSKELKVVEASEAKAEKVKLEKIYFPPPGKMAEIFEGGPAETSGKVAEVLKTKGLL